MIIVDTSIWIEFLKGNSQFQKDMSTLLESRSVLVLEGIFAELFRGVKNKTELQTLEQYWTLLPKIEEKNLLIEAGKLSNTKKFYSTGLSIIDCYILAAAIRTGSGIWTLDKALKEALLSL